MRFLATFGALILLSSAAAADSPFGHTYSEDADTILPITSYPLGESQIVAHSMANNLRLHWIEQDMCDRFGCLIVRNSTRLYKVAEFRIEAHYRDGTKRWSYNLLEHPLLPTEQVVRVKTASIDCDRPVKLLLKHRKTKEVLVMEGTANLCTTPGADNILRVEVKKPEVTVEENQTQ